MEIEKAKEFYKGHESAPLPRIDGVIEIEENELFKLLTEFAQQNTLTLESKVDEEWDFIDEFLTRCEDWMHDEDGNDVTLSRKYLNNIKQRLDNEKALRDKIRQLRVMYDEGEIIVDTKFDAVRLENILNQ